MNRWRPAEAGILPLATGAVHVWRVALDVPAPVRTGLWTLLAEDERDRARRFHVPGDAERFVVAHAPSV